MKHLGILLVCAALLPLALLDEYRIRKNPDSVNWRGSQGSEATEPR